MVCSRLGISRSLTSVEHPQWDGLVERMNRTLKTSLSIVVGNDLKSWAQHLPFVVFAYNTARQASTRFSPSEVMFVAKKPIQQEDSEVSQVQDWKSSPKEESQDDGIPQETLDWSMANPRGYKPGRHCLQDSEGRRPQGYVYCQYSILYLRLFVRRENDVVYPATVGVSKDNKMNTSGTFILVSIGTLTLIIVSYYAK
ncbi:hypothetical protein G6F42_021498 [Rhizopus arrhizus]|nr:hypothetical protein G6F42_021498 [Rhizopus arrhizus]